MLRRGISHSRWRKWGALDRGIHFGLAGPNQTSDLRFHELRGRGSIGAVDALIRPTRPGPSIRSYVTPVDVAANSNSAVSGSISSACGRRRWATGTWLAISTQLRSNSDVGRAIHPTPYTCLINVTAAERAGNQTTSGRVCVISRGSST